MSLDKSLRTSGTLSRHRNVLTRAERIRLLEENGKWNAEEGVFGLVKVAHRKSKVGGKSAKKDAAAEETK